MARKVKAEIVVQEDQPVEESAPEGLSIKRVPLEELKSDPNNPRDHSPKNLAAIKGSIARFGQVEPLVVQKDTGIVIGGNGRLEVMRGLGYTHVDVTELDLTDFEASALSIALNRTGELSSFNQGILGKTLQALKQGNFDIAEIGWDAQDFEDALRINIPIATLPELPDVRLDNGDSASTERGEGRSEPRPIDPKPSRDLDEKLASVGLMREVQSDPMPAGAVMVNADCLDHLRSLADNSIDAVVTDPPYGLGQVKDIGGLITAWMGDYAPDQFVGATGFMGKAWDATVPPPAVWKEVLRVLKPGGHALVFAAPRTHDLMGISLRIAGFEIRDCISWIFGSGFPKSLDISKAIDKKEGHWRGRAGAVISDNSSLSAPNYERTEKGEPITAAAAAAGWGTALKPACEPAILCRKPISEDTIADNVLLHGTGAINIDASRIKISDEDSSGWSGSKSWNVDSTFTESGACTSRTKPVGRFPANLILSHNDDCELVGTKEVGTGKTGMIEFSQPDIRGNNFNNTETKQTGLGMTYGKETVPDWKCTDGCPVALLDEQSGIKCGAAAPVKKKSTPLTTNIDNYKSHSNVGDDGLSFRGDTGGASRFFYCAKASTAERLGFNGHPTVKPLKLMSYLIRLITPPGGLLLDPFTGSGTTGVAAFKQGFRFLGIEKEKNYYEIACTRLKLAARDHTVETDEEDEYVDPDEEGDDAENHL